MKSRSAQRDAGPYKRIADYGLIGDCHSAALISKDGSIDWLCAPRFDSPSLFARILDTEQGGHFAIHPIGAFDSSFEYVGDTAVLRTTFRTPTGEIGVTGFMSVDAGAGPLPWAIPRAERRLVRLIEGIEGEVRLAIEIRPRPNYGKDEPLRFSVVANRKIQVIEAETLRLHTSCPLSISRDMLTAEVVVRASERISLVLELEKRALSEPIAPDDAAGELAKTLAFWRQWCARCSYRGAYEQAVMRSAITLKLLTYAPTGAMVAAPTTSLPETIGGVRNWDYRYTWIRDASFAAYALMTASHIEDAVRFFDWVCHIALQCRAGDLQIMYGVGGEQDLQEHILDHLEGYCRSAPVRIGNAASGQFQLDVYGELLDCFHTFRSLGAVPTQAIDHLWPAFRRQVDHVARSWHAPDSGIWEMRSEPRHFVYSKAMAWVAIDRGIKAAEGLHLPADLPWWQAEREAIHRDVLEKGYDSALRSFTQSYGSSVLDAANLLLPLVGFIEATEPRMKLTIEAIRRSLLVDGLVYRYLRADDGLPGEEAAFGICTFWLVENLVALGCVDDAQHLFEAMLRRASPLGLFAEEFDPRRNIYLGNFPQALTHIGLMNAAVKLTRALEGPSAAPLQAPSTHRDGAVFKRNGNLINSGFDRNRRRF